MDEPLRVLWAATSLRLWPSSLRLVSLPPAMLADAAQLVAACGGGFAALVLDGSEVLLTVDADLWRYSRLRWQAVADDGPFRAITLEVGGSLPLDLVGYLAPAVAALASAGVAILPQCGHRTDHLLVADAQSALAVATLEALIARCCG